MNDRMSEQELDYMLAWLEANSVWNAPATAIRQLRAESLG